MREAVKCLQLVEGNKLSVAMQLIKSCIVNPLNLLGNRNHFFLMTNLCRTVPFFTIMILALFFFFFYSLPDLTWLVRRNIRPISPNSLRYKIKTSFMFFFSYFLLSSARAPEETSFSTVLSVMCAVFLFPSQASGSPHG